MDERKATLARLDVMAAENGSMAKTAAWTNGKNAIADNSGDKTGKRKAAGNIKKHGIIYLVKYRKRRF